LINFWVKNNNYLNKKMQFALIYFNINKRFGMLTQRITIDPAICHGKPCIRGMRWPVEVILDMLESQMTFEEILIDHPELERDDILASLHYARFLVSGQSLQMAI
jgi:uncharacterized protein (DUF433 family)